MGRLRDFFKPRGEVVVNALEQAARIANSPLPRVDDYGGDGTYMTNQFFATNGPTPAHIEWLWGLCDEWARTIQRLRMEAWRKGLVIEPIHTKYCGKCTEGIDEENQACPGCGEKGTAVPPDPSERSKLKDFLKLANPTLREDLVQVGERKTEEGLKHGRSYVAFKMDYEVDENGIVMKSIVRGVYACQSGLIVPLRNEKTGAPGGRYVCLVCRTSKENYSPCEEPGKCPDCGKYLYEAFFGQVESVYGGQPTMFWLREEIHETKWPYTDGTSPVGRLWPKASTLLMMDWYAAWALDPKREKRPDKFLVTIGGDLKSIIEQLKVDAEARKRNPYKPSHLHIPTPAGALAENKASAMVLDLSDVEFKGQMIELRNEFEAAIRKHYGLSSLQGGDTDEEGGGLGTNKGTQIRTTAQVAESIQRAEEKWLLRLAQKLGAKQWTYKFPPALEEDEGRKAEDTTKWLDAGIKAAGAGLVVEWRAGKPYIQDGPIKPPAPPSIGDGVGGPSDDGPPDFPGGGGTDPSAADDDGDVDNWLSNINQASGPYCDDQGHCFATPQGLAGHISRTGHRPVGGGASGANRPERAQNEQSPKPKPSPEVRLEPDESDDEDDMVGTVLSPDGDEVGHYDSYLLDDDTLFVAVIEIDEDEQGNGYGSAVIRKLEEDAAARGVSRVELTADGVGVYAWGRVGYEVDDKQDFVANVLVKHGVKDAKESMTTAELVSLPGAKQAIMKAADEGYMIGMHKKLTRKTKRVRQASLAPTKPVEAFLWLREAVGEYSEVMALHQAIDSSRGLPKDLRAELSGPAGFVGASDEVFAEYAGLTIDAALQVKKEIVESLTQPQGWSTDSIVNRIQHHWEKAGFAPAVARTRAANAARTEVRSIASEFKRRNWKQEEADRGQKFRYHVRGADDHRTTKQSYWVRSQIPKEGLPLEDVERILDEALLRAKRGDFSTRGMLSHITGRPMRLPSNFQRRGFLIAFNDRDQVFRVA